jgi:hypothetical protein
VLNAGLLATAGIALSGCGRGDKLQLEVSDNGPFGFFSATEANMLSDVADIMIPQTETVGAAQTGTILYLDQLMQTWAAEATKLELQSFVESLNAHAQATHQSAYLNLPANVRHALLQEIDAASFSEAPQAAPVKAYKRVKWLIFHIHYTSEAANPDFVLIPGQYRGDVSETEYSALVEENRF